MRYEVVEVGSGRDGAVRTVRIPAGPWSARVAGELVAFAEDLTEVRDVRAVVITGDADFCVGPAPGLDPLAFGIDPAAALARLRCPVIVASRGRCASVGFEVALAADIRLADPSATFALDDVLRHGRLPCWGGTQRLPRAAGTSIATAMVLLGKVLDADAAARCGLIAQVCQGGPDLNGLVDETIDLLLGTGPLAQELAKEAVHRGSELPLRDGLRLEGDLNHLLQTTDDRAEGLAAFFAKRPPDFSGR